MSLYIKFNKLDHCYVIVVSLHEQNYPIKYYFKYFFEQGVISMTQQTPKGKTDFCTMCRQNTGYTLKKQSINKIIKGVEYSF